MIQSALVLQHRHKFPVWIDDLIIKANAGILVWVMNRDG